MKLLKGLFNSANKLDPQRTFDTISSGVDKLFFTNEEKSDAAKQAWDQWIEWYKLNSDENSARSVTRRILAIMFSSIFLFLLLCAGAVYFFDETYAGFLFDLSKSIFPLVSGILLFYFGYYGINSVIKTNSKNKSK
ncbi:hypothetical protein [uncultured Draconibacterium sp.]|uniref:hypothetical protein n=1 Tax=uncultured Draconibacterium sp. TaxID=1573823 RepID=UPI0025D5B733|nr:hypothetical protein [uncultured Draconibacterium sp.]